MADEWPPDADRRATRAFYLHFCPQRQNTFEFLHKTAIVPEKGVADRARFLFVVFLRRQFLVEFAALQRSWDALVVDGIPVRTVTDPREQKKMDKERDSWWKSRGGRRYTHRSTDDKNKEKSTLYESIRLCPPGPLADIPHEELVTRLKTNRGDKEAISEFNVRLFPWVYRYLLGTNSARTAEDAEEIVQTALHKAIKGIGKFEGRSELFTWVYRIAENTARDFYRPRIKEKRPRKLDALFSGTVEYTEDEGSAPFTRYDSVGEGIDEGLRAACEDDEAHAARNDDSTALAIPGRTGPDALTRMLIREMKARVHEHLDELTTKQRRVVELRLMTGVTVGKRFRWKMPADMVAKELWMPSAESVRQVQRRAMEKLGFNIWMDPYFEERHLATGRTWRRRLTHNRVVRRMEDKLNRQYRQLLREIVMDLRQSL